MKRGEWGMNSNACHVLTQNKVRVILRSHDT